MGGPPAQLSAQLSNDLNMANTANVGGLNSLATIVNLVRSVAPPTSAVATGTPNPGSIDYDMSDLPDWYRQAHDQVQGVLPDAYLSFERGLMRELLRRHKLMTNVPAGQSWLNLLAPPPTLPGTDVTDFPVQGL